MDAILSSPALMAFSFAVVLLLASAIWAHYRFADYDRLPRQFGFSLKPNSYAPSWVMVWMLPGFLIATLAFVALLPAFVSPEHVNGEPEVGVVFASVVCVAAQGLTLWLLTRWANQQT
ncbi:MAG: hypothetical protein AAF249_11655 [Pseudomonadota bacterium]